MSATRSDLAELAGREYAYGFVTDIETDLAPKGLSEEVIRLISAKKDEPDWLLEWRLRAYRHWLTLSEPMWQNVAYGPIDYDDIIY
ncbi:cysteine desulfurase activator complex subunit SufB, partial [mine drainage metagenome]